MNRKSTYTKQWQGNDEDVTTSSGNTGLKYTRGLLKEVEPAGNTSELDKTNDKGKENRTHGHGYIIYHIFIMHTQYAVITLN